MVGPQVRTKSATYQMLIGAVAGALTVGLAIPFVFADAEQAPTSVEAAYDFDPLAPDGTSGASGSADIDGSIGSDGLEGLEGVASDGSTADPGGSGPAGGAVSGAGQASASGNGAASPAAPGQPAATAPAAGGPKATSGDPIRIGFLVIDLGGAGGLGFPGIGSVEDQIAIFQAYVDDANARGGAAGRPIEAVYASFDPLSDASMRAACLKLTEDEKVFAAINTGGFVGDAILCMTQEHKTPFLSGVSGAPMEFYAKSGGRLFTMFWNSNRMVANLAQEAHDLGALKGKTVGILFDLRYGPASVAEQLKREVERLGHKVGRVSVFSADFGSASTQVPVEMNQHRAAGVNVMLNMANAVVYAQFVQQAEGQNYVLPYFNSDWNGANSDFYYSNMPDSYDGNLSFTIGRTNESLAGLPEPALDAECRKKAEKAIGRPIPQDDPEDTTFSRTCTFFTVLLKGLSGAGPTLTSASFSQAVQNLGDFDLPNMSGARLSPGRFDFGRTLRTMQWKADCKCLLPVTGFRTAKH